MQRAQPVVAPARRKTFDTTVPPPSRFPSFPIVPVGSFICPFCRRSLPSLVVSFQEVAPLRSWVLGPPWLCQRTCPTPEPQPHPCPKCSGSLTPPSVKDIFLQRNTFFSRWPKVPRKFSRDTENCVTSSNPAMGSNQGVAEKNLTPSPFLGSFGAFFQQQPFSSPPPSPRFNYFQMPFGQLDSN